MKSLEVLETGRFRSGFSDLGSSHNHQMNNACKKHHSYDLYRDV